MSLLECDGHSWIASLDFIGIRTLQPAHLHHGGERYVLILQIIFQYARASTGRGICNVDRLFRPKFPTASRRAYALTLKVVPWFKGEEELDLLYARCRQATSRYHRPRLSSSIYTLDPGRTTSQLKHFDSDRLDHTLSTGINSE